MSVSNPANMDVGREIKEEANRSDAYRYLTGEAEVGGRAALLAGRGAGAVGAAGRVLPFPPLRGGLSGRLSFGATCKEKQAKAKKIMHTDGDKV